MSFANKLKKIENDLIDIQNQGEIADKTKFFKDNIANFDKRNASLQKLIDHKNAIKIKNISVSINKEKLSQITSNLKQVKENFNLEPSNESITRGRALANYEKFSDEFNDIFERDIKSAWKSYLNSKYSKENYAQLLSFIIQSPENKKILEEFNLQYTKFNELHRRNNFDNKDFQDAEEITAELNRLRSQLKENYHEDVKKFLDEINSNGFATIDFLTEEVINFITNNHLKKDYVIKRNSDV